MPLFFNLDFLSSIQRPTAEGWHPHALLWLDCLGIFTALSSSTSPKFSHVFVLIEELYLKLEMIVDYQQENPHKKNFEQMVKSIPN